LALADLSQVSCIWCDTQHIVSVKPAEATVSLFSDHIRWHSSRGLQVQCRYRPFGSGRPTCSGVDQKDISTHDWMVNGMPDWRGKRIPCVLVSLPAWQCAKGGITMARDSARCLQKNCCHLLNMHGRTVYSLVN